MLARLLLHEECQKVGKQHDERQPYGQKLHRVEKRQTEKVVLEHLRIMLHTDEHAGGSVALRERIAQHNTKRDEREHKAADHHRGDQDISVKSFSHKAPPFILFLHPLLHGLVPFGNDGREVGITILF